jgi:hypothetical protein
MTRFINRPDDLREGRTVQTQRAQSPLFQGWGPKL